MMMAKASPEPLRRPTEARERPVLAAKRLSSPREQDNSHDCPGP